MVLILHLKDKWMNGYRSHMQQSVLKKKPTDKIHTLQVKG